MWRSPGAQPLPLHRDAAHVQLRNALEQALHCGRIALQRAKGGSRDMLRRQYLVDVPHQRRRRTDFHERTVAAAERVPHGGDELNRLAEIAPPVVRAESFAGKVATGHGR